MRKWIESHSLIRVSIKFFFLACLLVFVSCGKNDPVSPTGPGYGYNQAPPPQGGGYYPPQGGGNGYFDPNRQPYQQPPQYAPWMPIQQYFQYRQQPQVFINIWVDWQYYAQYRGCNVYDFSTFWFEYCPQQYGGTQMEPLFNQFDTSFYYWMQPQTQVQCQDSGSFWQYYNGFPYSQFDNYCSSGCW